MVVILGDYIRYAQYEIVHYGMKQCPVEVKTGLSERGENRENGLILTFASPYTAICLKHLEHMKEMLEVNTGRRFVG